MSYANMRNIKHIVHLMMENRGFDHMLGWLYDGATPGEGNNNPPLNTSAQERPFYGVPAGARQPKDASYYSGQPYTGDWVPIQKGFAGGEKYTCEFPASDPGEKFEDVSYQMYGPTGQPSRKYEAMMGFYIDWQRKRWMHLTHADDICVTLTPHDLPVLSTLAREFAMSDMWFSSVPTQTNPNRSFSLTGTSLGRLNNLSTTGDPFPEDLPTIFNVLHNAGHTWKIYSDHYWKHFPREYYTPFMWPAIQAIPDYANNISPIDQIKEDMANNQLPTFSYIEPTFWGQIGLPNDYHPPASLYKSEEFLKKVYGLITANPTAFEDTLFIVTFDEHGGTYDHLEPPNNATPPDSCGQSSSFPFTRYGLRIPTLFISPRIRKNTILRSGYFPGSPDPVQPFDHTSILRTICEWKGITSYRDPNDKANYLRARTAGVPTFEAVFQDGIFRKPGEYPKEKDLKLPTCRTVRPHAEDLFHPDFLEVLPHVLTQHTGKPVGCPEHQQMLDQILATCETRADLRAYFEQRRG